MLIALTAGRSWKFISKFRQRDDAAQTKAREHASSSAGSRRDSCRWWGEKGRANKARRRNSCCVRGEKKKGEEEIDVHTTDRRLLRSYSNNLS